MLLAVILFYTFRPAPYPLVQEPEHIHLYIIEPNTIPYYIDNYIFSDDPLLKQEDIDTQKNRGGPGLINLREENEMLIGQRDIILGLNIPDYKKLKKHVQLHRRIRPSHSPKALK